MEMKVRRRWSFVDVVCWGIDGGICGDEGEGTLFVCGNVVRRCCCRCGDDGEEMIVCLLK